MQSSLQTPISAAGSAAPSTKLESTTPSAAPMTDASNAASATETFTTGTPTTFLSAPTTSLPAAAPVIVEDEDDLDAPVKPGAKCLHLGCGKPFISQEESRLGDSEEATCVYHPAPVCIQPACGGE